MATRTHGKKLIEEITWYSTTSALPNNTFPGVQVHWKCECIQVRFLPGRTSDWPWVIPLATRLATGDPIGYTLQQSNIASAASATAVLILFLFPKVFLDYPFLPCTWPSSMCMCLCLRMCVCGSTSCSSHSAVVPITLCQKSRVAQRFKKTGNPCPKQARQANCMMGWGMREEDSWKRQIR